MIGGKANEERPVSYLPLEQWNGGLGLKSFKQQSRARGGGADTQKEGEQRTRPAPSRPPRSPALRPFIRPNFESHFETPIPEVYHTSIHMHKLDNGRADVEEKVHQDRGWENGTKKPTAVRQLGTHCPSGRRPQRLRSILQDASYLGRDVSRLR